MTEKTKTDTTTIKRGKTNGYNSAKLKANRVRKFEEACDRNADHNALTVEEKIEKARSRRGESRKEVSRLVALLGNLPKVVKPSTSTPPAVTPSVKRKSSKKKSSVKK